MAKNKNENSGCLSILLPFLNLDDREKKKRSETLPYRLRDDFLSAAEFSFYKVLESLLGSQLTIQSKVRLGDIFFVSRPNENRAYFGKISQKHLDFLICDAKIMQPIFGIELDDSSHDRKDRQTRDNFIDRVFKTANLPLLHFPARRDYNTREIADTIRPILKEYILASTSPKQAVADKTPVTSVPNCPKCGIPMVLRTVSKGDHKGDQFYGCSNYPKCREIKALF